MTKENGNSQEKSEAIRDRLNASLGLQRQTTVNEQVPTENAQTAQDTPSSRVSPYRQGTPYPSPSSSPSFSPSPSQFFMNPEGAPTPQRSRSSSGLSRAPSPSNSQIAFAIEIEGKFFAPK